VTAAAPQITTHEGARWALSDIAVMTWRSMLRVARSPELVFFGAIQPIMFVILFAYVFGNSIALPGFPYSYRQYLMAGIFVQTIVFGSVASTGIGVAEDMAKGMVDRFRSLPMTRSALLTGRTLGDVATNICTGVDHRETLPRRAAWASAGISRERAGICDRWCRNPDRGSE
jgi:ABC-2 type transport system permease protein